MSHPAWDAWIEMSMTFCSSAGSFRSHPAWDAWIEIVGCVHDVLTIDSRIPHGMRGLKLTSAGINPIRLMSHPAWDAWIEMQELRQRKEERMSHPAWDAWIEIWIKADL